MEPSPLDRHRRKLCGHCNEMLSYSAYRSHRDLYYDESKQKWNTYGPGRIVNPSADDEPQNLFKDTLFSEDDEEIDDTAEYKEMFSESNVMDTSHFDVPSTELADDNMNDSTEEFTIDCSFSESSTSSECEGIYTYVAIQASYTLYIRVASSL